MKPILVFILALPACAGTIISLDVSTSVQFGDPPCALHSTGPAVSCSSQGTGLGGVFAGGSACASASNDTIAFSVQSLDASSASALISLYRDYSWFNVQSVSDITAKFKFTCFFNGGDFGVTYSIGNNAPSAACQQSTASAVVPVTNGRVDIRTFLGASEGTSDNSRNGTITLAFLGFTDANGNPVAATVVPEPESWGLLAVGLVGIAALGRRP